MSFVVSHDGAAGPRTFENRRIEILMVILVTLFQVILGTKVARKIGWENRNHH